MKTFIALAQSAVPAVAPAVVASEYWADKKGVKLWVYRKRVEGATYRGRLFLVHGSSYSGKTMPMLGVNRTRFWHALESFLSMPGRVDLQGTRQH